MASVPPQIKLALLNSIGQENYLKEFYKVNRTNLYLVQ